MGNVLEFALGLQTSEFLGRLGFVSSEVLSFAGLAEVVRSAWDKTWDAMNKGAELRGLSSGTGESVKNLYMFAHGLEAIGGQTQSLPMFFLLVQNALSGVNAAGQRTNSMFAALGLDINKLRSQDSVQALTEIAAALAKINPTQATGIAEGLFGRFQAETVLQMARNMDTFQKAMGAGSNTGALMDKFAKTFEEVKADWGDIQSDVEGVWTAVAGGIGPEMHKIFSEVHEQIKDIGPAFSGAIEGGHIRELLSDSMNAALEEAGIFGIKIFDAIAVSFGNGIAAAIRLVFTDIVPHEFENLKGALKTVGAMAANAALATQLDDFQQEYTQTKDPAQRAKLARAIKDVNDQMSRNSAVGSQAEASSQADFNKRVGDAVSTAGKLAPQMIADIARTFMAGNFTGPAMQKFLHDMHAWNVAAIGPDNSGSAPAAGGASVGPVQTHWHPEFTSLEKMGFVMNGGRAGNLDQRKVDLLGNINNGIHQLIQTVGHGWGSGRLLPSTDVINPAIQNEV